MRCKPIPNPFPMSKCLFCSKKNFLLYFLKKYYNLIYIGYQYRSIRQKIISVFYRYRPIRNLNLSVIIGIGRYEKKLIGRPLGIWNNTKLIFFSFFFGWFFKLQLLKSTASILDTLLRYSGYCVPLKKNYIIKVRQFKPNSSKEKRSIEHKNKGVFTTH